MTMIPAAKAPALPRAAPAAGHVAAAPARADPLDVRAMRDALARARRQSVAEAKEPPAPPLVLAPVRSPAGTQGGAPAALRPRPQAKDESAPSGNGLAAAIPQAPMVAQITVPQAPAPQVDPTAFAMLIGQIWAREQAKGTREVQVRFGERAWPATGLRLVRGGDGALHIALLAGTANPTLDRGLVALREQLTRRGIALGALAVEEASHSD